MTPARAAEVLRRPTRAGTMADLEYARIMGAEALEFQVWLFSDDDYGLQRIERMLIMWHGEDSFLDYARAEWEKERKG